MIEDRLGFLGNFIQEAFFFLLLDRSELYNIIFLIAKQSFR